MKCPICGNIDSKVLDSRPNSDFSTIRRRRECTKCQKRFTTFETIENITFSVIKKNKTREIFDKRKLLDGMIKACEKRPVPISEIEKAATDIEQTLQSSMRVEIPSAEIGELVMAKLKMLDEVAYVRYASVYKQFKDINTFMEELKRILGEEK
ncbi:MAG: transcriptional repressor NrdR [Clostridia bacterium]|nr:transcriptional repressor NrdR [Clostridia bacterium]